MDSQEDSQAVKAKSDVINTDSQLKLLTKPISSVRDVILKLKINILLLNTTRRNTEYLPTPAFPLSEEYYLCTALNAKNI